MKIPRGFGKNYFSLSAITATVNSVTLHQISSRVQKFHLKNSLYEDDNDVIEELEEIEDTPWIALLNANKRCYCSCICTDMARKILALFPQKKRFPGFYKTLNSSVSPPPF